MSELRWEVSNQTAFITIARPPANALCRSLLENLDSVLTEIEKDPEVNVVILHGEGKFFAAGADIKEFTEVESGEAFAKLASDGHALLQRIETFPKPIIAALHGAALGGGLELAMSCHIRIAAEGTKLGLPELNLGLIPGYAGTQRLPQLVGRAKAAEMMLTSDPITAEDAKAWGLVNQVVAEDELLQTSEAMAAKIAAKSQVTTAMVTELLAYAAVGDFESGSDREAELFGRAFASEDGKEGIQAFLEKRAPEFQNK
ncbi:enoyl-CoA hydratase [Salsuginibacillus halophilus]|uniref:Enoyl-CoA hydratase n=1 Tax=Salsuginibacillus halophilus TaxID=517424 RepID=A0A2P8HCR5_9BACI|nr:enoyl-CoA hydratase [Salsuginibacillus halophilus]PSL44034.1 enoyl-CoA hydratase [Salsuginibacillus halophilus]